MSMARVRTASISALALGMAMATILTTSGCATSSEEMLPTHGTTMADIWEGRDSETDESESSKDDADKAQTTDLDRARAALRRPVDGGDVGQTNAAYTRTAANEIHSQFKRLPNPDLTLYIFPHQSGGSGEQVPVPGYSTVFPLYASPHYGQPGEQVEYQSVQAAASGSRSAR